MGSIQVQKVQSLTGHRSAIYSLQPTEDEGVILSSAGDGMIVRWDLRHPDEGEMIAKLPNSVYAIHVPEANLLLAGHNYDGIHLLDWRNKKEVASLQLTRSAIFDIQSLRGLAYVGTGDGEVVVVDYKKMAVVRTLPSGSGSARSIAVSDKRRELAVGYSDHFIRIFDLDTYALKKEWVAHQNSVFSVIYNHAHDLLLSGSRDARLKAWEPGKDYALRQEVVAHLFAINHIAYSPDNKHFVTCSLDKTVKVWDADRLALLKVIDKARHAGHSSSVNRLLWTSFQNRLISAGDDRMISVWDVIF
ncbi:MAG: WD40 repeat domain-containing protein [Bacteroidetes bacterium]|nr:WD40 repeat domain-containing protein [Bacteroidota bacterium]